MQCNGYLIICRSKRYPPAFSIIIGTEKSDLEGLDNHPLIQSGQGQLLISPKMGSSAQRNCGLETLKQQGYFAPGHGRFFCSFFDEDYRPDQNWLKCAAERFEKGDIVGLTGHVLADGVGINGLTEEQAIAFLNDETPPQPHWASGAEERTVDSVYGCNMAFMDTVVQQTRFDENLPLYGWQEDRDYTGMAKKLGRVIYFPGCRGVHLGSKGGRTSGLRFGYSQIANPLYLMKKGTMGYGAGLEHMARNMAANLIRSLTNSRPYIDYKGRLRGNLMAVWDTICLRCNPRRIVDNNF